MTEPEDLNATKTLARLVNQLGSPFESRREKAYAALREAHSEKVRQLLIARLTKDLRTTRRWTLRPMKIAFAAVKINFLANRAMHVLG
jgi:hypothetical protein